MSYLGNAPARSFISFERQVFTIVNSQTAYTLSHSVTNENDIRLVVNNVVQEPGSGKAYTASGTTLTLSAALTNGTDEMYCVFLGRATATNAPAAGSVGTSQLADDAVTTAKILDLNVTTGKIAADAITNAKIADDAISDEQLDPTVITGQTAETSIATDDLILLSDTSASGALRKMTRANFVSGVGGTNAPFFKAYMSANQGVSNTTSTTVAFDRTALDTASSFNTSTYKYTIPSGYGGKWLFTFMIRKENFAPTRALAVLLRDSGVSLQDIENGAYATYGGPSGSSIANLNEGQTVYVNFYHDGGSSKYVRGGGEQETTFSGFKLID
jgi:hypothetical protein